FPHLTINSIIGDKDVYGLAYKRNHILWFENTWAKNMTLDCVPDGEHELDVDLTYQYIVAGPQAKILKQRGANCTKLPVPDSPNVIGILAGIQKQGAIYYLQGWTCVKNYYGSITVGIYFNGDNNSGEHFKNYLASIPSENNINLACETSGTQHRFKIPLTAAELAQHQGKTIYIYGIGPNGFGIGELGKSGTFTVPLAI
ncbi:MAG: hypothetical protein KDD40_07815, partial [Bdellovibrionales bacterium]|nr:hypothetical protein [Bdellovibrionales bacterium]